jgi:hypothetical protein
MVERRGVYRFIFVGKTNGKTFLGRLRRRWECSIKMVFQEAVAYRGGGFGAFKPPPPPRNSEVFDKADKAEPNSQFCGKYIRNNLIRIRVSLICKLSGTPD